MKKPKTLILIFMGSIALIFSSLSQAQRGGGQPPRQHTCSRSTAETLPAEITRVMHEGNQAAARSSLVSGNARISDDGRYVSFISTAANFGEDGNNNLDVFVYDRLTGCTILASKKSANGRLIIGNQFLSGAAPSIGPEGKVVVFTSSASNIFDAVYSERGSPPLPVNKPNILYHHRDFDSDGVLDELSGMRTVRITVGKSYDAGRRENVSAEPYGESPAAVIGPSVEGQMMVFQSKATNLIPSSLVSSRLHNIYYYNRIVGHFVLVSDDTRFPGGGGNNNSEILWSRNAVSQDGRLVVFSSSANNLVADDRNRKKDIFLRDLAAAITTQLTAEGSSDSDQATITPDGRHIVFRSFASNLIPDEADTNRFGDIFIYDRLASDPVRRIRRVSKGLNFQESNGQSASPDISNDGRFVVYESEARNLVANDTNNRKDVFVVDLQTGGHELVSKSLEGVLGNGTSWDASISGDGRWIAFDSIADNLVSGDTNRAQDVFVVANPLALVPEEATETSSPPTEGPDVTAPVISELTAMNVARDSAVISWMTDDPGTSEVRFGITNHGGIADDTENFRRNHTMVLLDLVPNSIYYFYVCSVNEAGLRSCSTQGAHSFQTLP